MRRLRLIAVLFGLICASLSRGTRAVGQAIAPTPGLRPIASSLDRKPQQQTQPAPARQPTPANPPPFSFPVPDDGLTSGPPASPNPAPRKAVPELLRVTFRAEAEGQQAAPAASASAAASISATTIVGGVPPVVHLQKIGPANLTVGQSLTYEIVLKNTGASPATQVRLEDELPTGARLLEASPRPDHSGSRLLWTLGRLEPGEERHWRVRIHPAGEGEIRSSATVTYVAAVASSLRTQIAQPRLAVTQSGPENLQLGEPATFQIQVKNTGSGPATAVLVRDRLPAGLKHEQGDFIEAELGTLGPGETKSLSLQVTAIQAGRHVNDVVVTASAGLQTRAEAAVLVLEPALRLRESGPQGRFLDREVEYDLEVSNPGTAPATNVRVIDTLPDGLQFVAACQGGHYDPASRQVTWQLGTLAATERRGLSIRASAKQRGDWTSHAAALADSGLEKKAEATVHVSDVPALLLEVSDLNDPIEVGAETTYEIRVVNHASNPSTNLRILAMVPDGLQARAASGPTAHRIQGQQVIFEPLAELTSNADLLYRVRVRGVKAGDVRFKVQMCSDQLATPLYEEESTHVYSDGGD